MSDLPDLPPSSPPGRPPSKSHLVVPVLILAAVVVVAALLWPASTPLRPISSTALPHPAAAAPSAPSPAAEAAAPQAEAAASTAAAHADAETRLRTGLAELSDDAHLRTWSSEPNLLHRLTAAVNLIAEGESPRPMLGFLTPRTELATTGTGDEVVESEHSIQRYDVLTRVLTSLDPAKVAKLYVVMRPFAQATLTEMAPKGRTMDSVLHSAITRILETPVPAHEPALVVKGVGYAFADPALEALAAPQKNLLRMGTAHARAIQSWLGAVEKALPPHAS